ncbi:hypothetical protein GC197_11975 [bacterium]|nr:hypothetical protein [bacterium]
MSGFALAVEVPRRKLGEKGFTCESECPLFGEIARLNLVGHSTYEVQIISIVPREDDAASATRSRISLRLGTRVVRELYEEERNSMGRNLRLVAVIVLAMLVSLYCTAQTFSGQLAGIVPNVEIAWQDILQDVGVGTSGDRTWRKEIAFASKNGYVVPNTPQMEKLIAISRKRPALNRVQNILVFEQDHALVNQMNLSPEQLLSIRMIALEAKAEMERLWAQMKHQQDVFREKLVLLLERLETRILANLTPTQAELWLQPQVR